MTDTNCPLCGATGNVKDSYTGLLHYECTRCSKEWML